MTSLLVAALLAAHGAPERIGVLPMVLGEPPVLRISELAAELARAGEWRPGVKLLGSEEVLVAAGDEAMARLRVCGASSSCIGAELGRLQLDRALLLIVNDRVEPAVLSLRCVEPGRECGDQAHELDALAAPAAFGALLERMLDRLGHPPRARLDVSVTPGDAEVIVEDRAPALAGTFWLEPGRYTVRARREGWVETSTSVELHAATGARVGLHLREEDEPLSWWWIAGGIGAALVAGVAAAAVLSGRGECLCVGPPESCRGC